MFFRKTSISTKMMLLACGPAAVALAIACVGFAWHSVDAQCAAKGKQLHDQAEFLGWQAGPALALRDAQRGQQLLASFWTNSTVEEARLYGNDRKVLATWGEQKSFTAPAPTPKGYRFVGFSQVEVVHNVVVGSQRLGIIYVRANTSDLMASLVASAKFTGSVIALAMLVVVFVALRLRRTISRPLLELARAAKQISIDTDSTIRIHSDAHAELKTLQDAFNHMLDRVESSELAVRKANRGIEDGVIARTKELSRELRRHQETEVELESAKDAAEAANQATTRLVANLRRQLRTPLAGIMRLTESLIDELSDLSPEDWQARLATIHGQGARLVELVDDIPAGSQGEPEQLEVAQIPHPLREMNSDELATGASHAIDAGTTAGQPRIESADASPPRAGAPPQCDATLAGRRILVVDDGENNRKLIQSVLRGAGAEALIANDGLAAIHATDRHQPELILMDLQMPVMDGCSATRELRSNGHTLPIIALLADAAIGDEEKCLRAGCNGVLAKPIDATRLLEMVARELNAEAAHAATQ